MSVYFFKQKSGLCNQNIYVFEKYLNSHYLEIYKCAAHEMCRLACPQQILLWFMQWNWLKREPWSFSLSTFLSPTFLIPLLSVPNICSGKIPAKVPLWTSIFWYQVMLHQSSYIMSLQTYKMLLPPWHNLTRCHNTSSQKHDYCCYFFQSAPSSSMISVKTHRKVLLSLYHFSAPQRVPAKEAFRSQTRSGNTNPQLPHRWGDPGVTLGLAHTPKAPSWKSGQLPLRPWPWPSFPSSLQGCKSKGHISTRQQVSSLRCTRTSGRGNPEILPSLCSNNCEYPHRCQRPQKNKTPQRKTLHGKAS